MQLSVITPAFNEAANLPALYERLAAVTARLGLDWEWLVIDDHSSDGTFAVVSQLAARDPRVRGIRFARNTGSHAAISCGLHHVSGDAAAMVAADLQDPPETLEVMLERWRQGAKTVWAVRRQRPGERSHQRFAALYYWIMRRVGGLKEMPARGADFFLVDRAVIDVFRTFPERHVSVFALLTWIGFRQDFIEYDKQPRMAGASGWTLRKKITLVVDSITAFSDLPIRLSIYAGLALVALSIPVLLGGVLLLPALGAGLLMVVALLLWLGGVQLIALGLVGQYVWRAFDEARRRPAWVIEAVAGASNPWPARLGHVE